MKLGIGTYTFTWAIGVPGQIPKHPLSPTDLLRRAVALKVGLLQFCDNLPLTRLTPAELNQFFLLTRIHQIDVEIGTRGLEESNLHACLNLARIFNAPFVRLVIDAVGHEPTPEEIVDRLRPIVREYAATGVKLALENHDRFSARSLVELVEELGPAHTGICLDTVNSLGALEGPEVVVERLAPYTLNLHVKDFIIRRMNSQMGFDVVGCPVGRGRLDVPWLLEHLHAVGRDVNAIVELWTPPAESLEATISRERQWAEASIDYLRRWIPA